MLDKLRKIVKKKNEIDQTQEWYKGSITYFEGLKDEVEEVKAEMKENNSVYLEDELGDILWDYLNLLEGLKQEGKITSMEKVLKRAEKKYSQRINAINGGETQKIRSASWKKTKEKQKDKLKEEHDKLYGDN